MNLERAQILDRLLEKLPALDTAVVIGRRQVRPSGERLLFLDAFPLEERPALDETLRRSPKLERCGVWIRGAPRLPRALERLVRIQRHEDLWVAVPPGPGSLGWRPLEVVPYADPQVRGLLERILDARLPLTADVFLQGLSPRLQALLGQELAEFARLGFSQMRFRLTPGPTLEVPTDTPGTGLVVEFPDAWPAEPPRARLRRRGQIRELAPSTAIQVLGRPGRATDLVAGLAQGAPGPGTWSLLDELEAGTPPRVPRPGRLGERLLAAARGSAPALAAVALSAALVTGALTLQGQAARLPEPPTPRVSRSPEGPAPLPPSPAPPAGVKAAPVAPAGPVDRLLKKLPPGAFWSPVSVPLPEDPYLWPGAPRDYRGDGAIHRSIDYICPPGTDVNSASAGIVVAVAEVPTVERWAPGGRDRLLDICEQIGDTPEPIYRLLVGNHVIVMTRLPDGSLLHFHYNHLQSVAPGLRPGDFVQKGQFLGEAGFSGTSSELAGDPSGSHLDFCIEVDGVWIGRGLSLDETRRVYRHVLAPSRRPAPLVGPDPGCPTPSLETSGGEEL